MRKSSVVALAILAALIPSGCLPMVMAREHSRPHASICHQGYAADAADYVDHSVDDIAAQPPEIIIGYFLLKSWCTAPREDIGRELASRALNPLALQEAILSAKDTYDTPEAKELLDEFYWEVRTFGQG